MRTLRGTRAVEAMLGDSRVPADLRRHLSLVSGIRDFSIAELALPDNASYRRYRKLDRPYAVWNLVAAPEFSVKPVQWCFPVAGCVAYRGYFSQKRALRFATGLRGRGLDVSVEGVRAFSTLGWFKDPVLSTFVDLPPAELAGLVFHELAHQVAYAKDDTSFNESFASFVEQEGVRRWLRSGGRQEEIAAYEESQDRREAAMEILLLYRARLAELYASELGETEMRQRKLVILAALEADYEQVQDGEEIEVETRRQGTPRFNNADLALLAAYTEHLEAFAALLADCSGDFESFHAEARRLAELPATERERELERLRQVRLSRSETTERAPKRDVLSCGRKTSAGRCWIA
jgi:predicted aminopeptidase